MVIGSQELQETAKIDAAEHEQFGEHRGDELPRPLPSRNSLHGKPER